jgi:hypothetical protein
LVQCNRHTSKRRQKDDLDLEYTGAPGIIPAEPALNFI